MRVRYGWRYGSFRGSVSLYSTRVRRGQRDDVRSEAVANERRANRKVARQIGVYSLPPRWFSNMKSRFPPSPPARILLVSRTLASSRSGDWERIPAGAHLRFTPTCSSLRWSSCQHHTTLAAPSVFTHGRSRPGDQSSHYRWPKMHVQGELRYIRYIRLQCGVRLSTRFCPPLPKRIALCRCASSKQQGRPLPHLSS